MKKAKLDLRTLLARRKTTLSKLMQSKGLSTTQELNAWCDDNNLTAPDGELLATLGAKPAAVKATKPAAPAKKRTTKKKSSKKKAQAKKAPTVVTETVAEAAVETPEPVVESKEADTQDTPAAPAPTFSKTASTRIS